MTTGFAIKTFIQGQLKSAKLFYRSGCSSEGEYFGVLVPVVAEQPESGGPGVEIDHDLHQADVDQGHQHAHSQGQGALDSAGLGRKDVKYP